MSIIDCKRSFPIKKYSSHSHKTWEIVCQLEGEVVTQVEDKVFTLSAGEIMLVPPNTAHKGSSNNSFTDMSVCSDDLDFGKFAVIKDSRGDIASIISIMIRIWTEREKDYKSVANSLLAAACEMINHEIGYSSSFPAVEQIKKEIYENLSNADFSLAAAISKTGFDKDYFRRRFKSETGKTPQQYMTDMRIVQAKQLLRDEKLFSVSSVANNCGFSDSLYFSTCFKKHTGLSPFEYRKRHL